MTFDVRTTNLEKLNSMTKYPSIETFHQLNPQGGMLTDQSMAFAAGDTIHVTEKVDGTNARIVLLPDGTYIIGRREDYLHARGDLIPNPSMSIVATLREEADRLVDSSPRGGGVTVYYFEVFGGNVTGASKQYTSQRELSYRLFDIARIDDYESVLTRERAQISSWRENGGQRWTGEEMLQATAEQRKLNLTPRLHTMTGSSLPTELEATHAWLKELCPRTQVALDPAAGGRAEGVVIRTADRATIAKIRFEDYERTLNRHIKGKGQRPA
jgi:hypothetical protein